jgi:hypothetical protein
MNTSMSRRGLLACLPAAAVPVPTASVPDADPIFKAIEEHKAANVEWDRLLLIHDAWVEANKGSDGLVQNDHDDPEYAACDAACDREAEAWFTFWRTMPTTAAGWAAYFAFLRSPRYPLRPQEEDLVEQFKNTMFVDAWVNCWAMEPGRSEGDGGVPALGEWLHSMEVALRRMTIAQG